MIWGKVLKKLTLRLYDLGQSLEETDPKTI